MKRLPMRKIREVLRLRADGLSGRQVARSLSLGRGTVLDYLRRAATAGLSWPLSDDLSDADLEARLYPPLVSQSARQIPQPDWGVCPFRAAPQRGHASAPLARVPRGLS